MRAQLGKNGMDTHPKRRRHGPLHRPAEGYCLDRRLRQIGDFNDRRIQPLQEKGLPRLIGKPPAQQATGQQRRRLSENPPHPPYNHKKSYSSDNTGRVKEDIGPLPAPPRNPQLMKLVKPRIEAPYAYGQQGSAAERPATRPKEKQCAKKGEFHDVRYLAKHRLNEQGDGMNGDARGVLMGQDINGFFGHIFGNVQAQAGRLGRRLRGKRENNRHPAHYGNQRRPFAPPGTPCLRMRRILPGPNSGTIPSYHDFSCIVTHIGIRARIKTPSAKALPH